MMYPTYRILGIDKRVVDSDNLDIVMRERVAKDNATNSAEAVDANFHSHLSCLSCWINRDDELAQRLGSVRIPV
jgi:hypothetical protein